MDANDDGNILPTKLEMEYMGDVGSSRGVKVRTRKHESAAPNFRAHHEALRRH